MKRFVIVAALLLLVACESEATESIPIASQSIPIVTESTPITTELTPTTNSPVSTSINKSTQAPVSPTTPTSSTPAPDFKDLTAALVNKVNGFRINLANEDGFSVVQTLLAPNSSKVVHIIRKFNMNASHEDHFRESALVIQPDTQEMKVYPMMNALITDDYSVDSVCRAFGFIDDQRLVYVAVHGDDSTHKITYSIDSLNINTGQTETLFNNQPIDISEDFFNTGWINEQRNTLVLSSFRGGEMWVFDLVHKTSRLMKGSYPSEWPLYSVNPAPSGNFFWFKDKLYDLDEKIIAQIDKGKGFEMYPAIQWRKDSQYMAYHYTLNEDSKNILGGEDTIIIAPQGIKFMNSTGKVVQKVEMDAASLWRVELAGWITGKDYAVIRYYQLLLKAGENTPSKIKLNYKLFNLMTGELIPIQQALKIEDIAQPAWLESNAAFDPSAIVAVDLAKHLFWSLDQPVTSFMNTASSIPMWVNFDYGTFKANLYQYSEKTHQIITQPMEKIQNIEFLLNNKWIVDKEMNYTELKF